MSRYHIDFVTLDLAAQRRRFTPLDDSRPQPTRHGVDIVLVESQFPRNLLIRQVQPHEIQARHPDPQRLVVSGEDRSRQVVEPSPASLAPIPLPIPLRFIKSLLGDVHPVAVRTAHARRPPHVAHHVVTFRVVDQILDVQHAVSMLNLAMFSRNFGPIGRPTPHCQPPP
jgi:hypothetical protein